MNRFDKRLDASTFIFCFIVGTAGIITLKWLDMSQFVVTACPVAIMFVYGVLNWRGHQAQAGDNLYYLGLLYTLVSLAVSLFEFTPKDEDIESITPIITNFGIAIFSTILGVAGRVFFNQMAQITDTEEIERVARIKLVKAADDLSDQLSEATRDFSIFRLEMQQIIRDGLYETKEVIDTEVTNFAKTVQTAEKSFEESRQKLQDGFNETYKALQLAVTDFSETVQAANEGLEEGRQKLQDRSYAVSESMSELVTRINRIQVPEDFLERIMDSPIQRIEKGADRIGTAGEALADRLNNVQIPTNELERSLQQAIEGFCSEIERDLRVHFDKVTHELETILTEFSQAVKAVNKGFEVGNKEMRDSASTFVASIRDLSKRIDDVEVSVDLPERILHPSIEPIEKSAARIGTAGDILVQMLKDVQVAADELEQGIRKTTAALPENVPKG